MSEVVFVTKL